MTAKTTQPKGNRALAKLALAATFTTIEVLAALQLDGILAIGLWAIAAWNVGVALLVIMQRGHPMTAPEMVRIHVRLEEVDGRCTLVLRKDGVTVQGPASDTAPLTVPMPQFGYVKNVYASVSDGWEFVEAWYEMTQDEVNMASEWSDYRKHYGVGTELHAAHEAFKAGWQAARGSSHESVQS